MDKNLWNLTSGHTLEVTSTLLLHYWGAPILCLSQCQDSSFYYYHSVKNKENNVKPKFFKVFDRFSVNENRPMKQTIKIEKKCLRMICRESEIRIFGKNREVHKFSPPSGETIRDRTTVLFDELWPSVRRCQMWNFGVDIFNNKGARVKIRIFRISSLVFERIRIFENELISHQLELISSRMTFEWCFCDLPVLRNRV